MLIIMFCLALQADFSATPALPNDQKHFSAEDSATQSPVRVPQAVLAILRIDEDLKTVLENSGDSPRELRSWFSATIAHLRPQHEHDDRSRNRPLLGANVTPFWIFRPTRSGYAVILRTSAHDLLIESARNDGFLDIKTMSATASQVTTVSYKFNGNEYVAYRQEL